MALRRVLVVGGGFAGLWAAAGAARALDLFGARGAEVVLLNPDPFHVVRVRCYEADLAPVRLPLDEVLRPIGVRRVEGRATGIDRRRYAVAVRLAGGGGDAELPYDRLVLAAGSALFRPDIPGLAAHAFDVDTYAGAARLALHFAALGEGGGAGPDADSAGRWTAAVIGAGLVGIEIACELPERLRNARRATAGRTGEAVGPVRVLLLDHGRRVGAGLGEAALPAITEALSALGVETRAGAVVLSVDAGGVTLAGGERIAVMTTLCAAGMRASPLAKSLPAACDPLGRLPVDRFLGVEGVESIYAAGDIARARADDAGHATVMSCQHARPMGRIAGHNAACDLLGRGDARVAFAAPDYVTVLDLGPWGAVYTAGWDRGVLVAAGARAKEVKRAINGRRIYPPRDGDRLTILDAASPVFQPAPAAPPK